MNKVGIGIPIFKDLLNIKEIVREIESSPNLSLDFYILDNGSKSSELTEYLNSLKVSNVKILEVEENCGFGGGIKYLLQNIENEFIGWMPGNGKVNPKDLFVICDLILAKDDIAAFKATRSSRSRSERLKTFLAGTLISLYYQTNLFDSGGTPTVVRRDLVPQLLNGPDDFSFEAFSMFTIRKSGIELVRSAIPYGLRRYGVSHWQRGIKSELKLLIRILAQRKAWKYSIDSYLQE